MGTDIEDDRSTAPPIPDPHAGEDDAHGALRAGMVVGKYEILETLGQGGFGITYRARDTRLKRDVAIKEYLPTSFAMRRDGGFVLPRSTRVAEDFRWGRERFLDEAQTLATLEEAPGIVNVYDFLEANGTAYMVMALLRGGTLEARLKRDGRLPQPALKQIVYPLLDGLETVHAAGFMHRDIKPANILLDAEGRPTLIDFGASRVALQGRTQAMTAVYTPGYAPFEQSTSAKQGPATDIYALAATLYHCVTGAPPPAASDRMMDDDLVPAAETGRGRYAPSLLAAIDAGLRLRPAERPQTIADLRRVLAGHGAGVAAALPGAATREMDPAAPTRRMDAPTAAVRRRPRAGLIAAGIAALALSGGGAWYATRSPAAPESVEAVMRRAEEEARRQTALVARLREEEAARKSAEEQRVRIENARRQAEEDERRRIADEARQRVEAEAARKAAEEARIRTEAEAARKVAADKVAAEEAERQRVAAEAERQRVAAESSRRVAEEKAAAEAAIRRKAEEEARARAEADAARRREEERRIAAEETAKAERLAQEKALADSKTLAEAEAARRAAEEKAAAEAAERRKAEETAKSAAEIRKQAEVAEAALRLSEVDRKRVQVALTSLGHNTAGTDGAFGPRSRAMIAAWQKSRNETDTGYLTAAQLTALRTQAAPAIARWDEEQRKEEEAKRKAEEEAKRLAEEKAKREDEERKRAPPAATPPPAQTAAAAAPAGGGPDQRCIELMEFYSARVGKFGGAPPGRLERSLGEQECRKGNLAAGHRLLEQAIKIANLTPPGAAPAAAVPAAPATAAASAGGIDGTYSGNHCSANVNQPERCVLVVLVLVGGAGSYNWPVGRCGKLGSITVKVDSGGAVSGTRSSFTDHCDVKNDRVWGQVAGGRISMQGADTTYRATLVRK